MIVEALCYFVDLEGPFSVLVSVVFLNPAFTKTCHKLYFTVTELLSVISTAAKCSFQLPAS